MKKMVLNGLMIALIAGFSIWLYANEEAAKPGGLSRAHDFIADCAFCHIPWQGVTDEMCRQCHFFDDVDLLRPWLRFHEAEKHCLECHTEHLGYLGDISEVDHTLFNPELSCTDCHYDPHDGNFGDDCRICHSIRRWEVEGFRHPPADNRNCSRCHNPPASHHAPDFWEQIREGHQEFMDHLDDPSVNDCWQCHTTHRWGHRMMPHDLQMDNENR